MQAKSEPAVSAFSQIGVAIVPGEGKRAFANGVALSADERTLFVAETCEYRVWAIDVAANGVSAKAAAKGTPEARVLLANLPGYPDNLRRGENGRIWLGFTKPRSAVIG